MRYPALTALIIALTLLAGAARAAEETERGPRGERARANPPAVRAARSVHLHYPATEATAWYNEMTVERTVPGSFFMAVGFDGGYFGLQELSGGKAGKSGEAGGKKVVIFSVWDPTRGDDPDAVPADQRVEILYKADDVLARRFGGEGTGGQSFFDYDWEVGRTYRFVVMANVEGNKTAYAAWFYLPDKEAWKHLVTFRTTTAGKPLRGVHSFVEDFRRDGRSADEARRAAFGNGWVRDAKGQWHALTKARFTASRAAWEAKETIDAGLADGGFYLQTGGDTRTTTPLNTTLERPRGGGSPPELPKD